MTALEVFAGAGGLALGIHEAGFEHVGLIEWDKNAVATLRHNCTATMGISPDLVIHKDASGVDYSAYEGEVDLLSGGPPCQPFSGGGNGLGHADERNMFPAFLEAIRLVRPRAVIIENVKGLMRSKFSDYLEYVTLRVNYPHALLDMNQPWEEHLPGLRTLTSRDFDPDERYHVDVRLVDTADFGVPQRRERVVFMALRADRNVSRLNGLQMITGIDMQLNLTRI
jgi:DNA (cytosine-5)-methyltransferase 1